MDNKWFNSIAIIAITIAFAAAFYMINQTNNAIAESENILLNVSVPVNDSTFRSETKVVPEDSLIIMLVNRQEAIIQFLSKQQQQKVQ